MQLMYNAYNKLIYSIERLTPVYKVATNHAKTKYLTMVNCICAGFVYSRCLGVKQILLVFKYFCPLYSSFDLSSYDLICYLIRTI